MTSTDCLQRFVFESLPVRGELAFLDQAWQEVLRRRDYPPVIRRILGEALVAAALLGATLKHQGHINLQLESNGPLSLLLVQGTADGLRGLARWQGPLEQGDLTTLCPQGRLLITLDPGNSSQRYQGVVDLHGDSLSAALEDYFARSEQLPTRLYLLANESRAAGMLLQRLPSASAPDDDWQRLNLLFDTLSPSELLECLPATLLHRLFNEDDIRLFNAQTLAFYCRCSRERSAGMLRSMGWEEIQTIVAEEGEVRVDCEFCGASYRFDAVDSEILFNTDQPTPPSTHH